MWFRDTLIAQKDYLYREQQRIKGQLKGLPKEKLITKHAHGRNYYYIERKGKRISLFENPIARNQYLRKQKLEAQLAAISRDLPLLEKFLMRYEPLMLLDSEWDQLEAEKNAYYSEERKHVYKGVYFRSKSEMLIATVLTSYNIEFKYEARMKVNGRYIYPDFIAKRPKDGKIFIWEHFGMMSEDKYRRKNFERLEEYHQEGIDLWDNFIISFDQEDGAIDMDYIDKIIKLYLL